MKYTCVKKLNLGGTVYFPGDTIPGEAILPQRTRALIGMKLITASAEPEATEPEDPDPKKPEEKADESGDTTDESQTDDQAEEKPVKASGAQRTNAKGKKNV